MRHAVIMAGGSGTRLWPLSRRMRPKQLLRLFDGRSLLQIARRRLEPLFPPENIWVITSMHYLDLVAAELPDLPRENLIGEPVGCDTANAIGLGANLIALRDPDATMAVFTADHLITPEDAFAAAIRTGLTAAEQSPDALVTFGITPVAPHPGYGYLHRGDEVAPGVFRVLAFKEKPTREVAAGYLATGAYLWNAGMFAWRVPTILAELEWHLPDNARTLRELAPAWAHPLPAPLAERFAALHRISIDFAVLEKAAGVLTVEMRVQWTDVGSWTAIAGTQPADAAGNVALARNTLIVDGRRNVLVTESGHLIAALGVDDLVIIHTDDATLVCRRDQVERIKDLAALRIERFSERYE